MKIRLTESELTNIVRDMVSEAIEEYKNDSTRRYNEYEAGRYDSREDWSDGEGGIYSTYPNDRGNRGFTNKEDYQKARARRGKDAKPEVFADEKPSYLGNGWWSEDVSKKGAKERAHKERRMTDNTLRSNWFDTYTDSGYRKLPVNTPDHPSGGHNDDLAPQFLKIEKAYDNGQISDEEWRQFYDAMIRRYGWNRVNQAEDIVNDLTKRRHLAKEKMRNKNQANQ